MYVRNRFAQITIKRGVSRIDAFNTKRMQILFANPLLATCVYLLYIYAKFWAYMQMSDNVKLRIFWSTCLNRFRLKSNAAYIYTYS